VTAAAGADCWVLSDGAAGNENQALALAHALGHRPRVLRLALRRPWRWLAPLAPADPRRVLAPDCAAMLTPPWPTLAIGCGRAAAAIVAGLGRLSGGRSGTVQILDPRRRRSAFDVIVAPVHDRLDGDNVVACLGGLNAIDDAWLAAGRAAFPQLGALPAPRTAVLVGGPVRGLALDRRYLDGLLARLEHWLGRDGGSALVTCSRRTPAAVAARLRAFSAGRPGRFWAGPDDGGNPYAAMLGWADRIVVTPDSSNLLTEACATGVPVLAWMPRPLPGKRGDLVRDLVEGGWLRPMQLEYAPWTTPPLRELDRVAGQVRARLAGRG
jgi:mitochondrial fission protein ELM1